eukprot:scaffold2514_cov373-Prasinococcus_capsulatus_cf.AAC.9
MEPCAARSARRLMSEPMKTGGLEDGIQSQLLKDLGGIHPSFIEQVGALSGSWLKLFKHSMVFTKKAGARTTDYIVLAAQLQKIYPDKKWYIMAHDDSYLFAYNLLCELADKEHKEPIYTGATHCKGPNFACRAGGVKYLSQDGKYTVKQRGDTTTVLKPQKRFSGGYSGLGGWINGGAGVVLSGALVQQVDFVDCVEHYSKAENWPYDRPVSLSLPAQASDVVLACCVADYGGTRLHSAGFTAGRPGFHECQCDNGSGGKAKPGTGPKCSLRKDVMDRRISYHHLNAGDLTELYRDEQKELRLTYKEVQKFPVHTMGLYT